MDELAERVSTSRQQVARHEKGERRLTIQWLHRYAMALSVAPADLLTDTIDAEVLTEVEPATIDGMPQISRAIASRGLSLYRVLASHVSDVGVQTDDIITVDTSDGAVRSVKIGDLVIARIAGSSALILRQFIPPATLITNERGNNNVLLRLDDRSVTIELVGVVIPG